MNQKLIRILPLFILVLAMGRSCDHSWTPDKIREQTGDLCIRNVTLIDPVRETVVPGMDILIRSGRIDAVIPTGTTATNDFDLVVPGDNFYALPGFVNSHTHLWQHLSRSVSPSEQLQQWIPEVYKPAFHLTDEEFYELNLAACYDALLHGITSVLDWTMNADEGKLQQVLDAMIASGLGGTVTWPHTSVFLPFETEKREFERKRAFARNNDRDLFIGHLPPERIPVPLLYDGILLAKETSAPIAEHIMENVQCQRDWLSTVKSYLKQHGEQLGPEDRKFLEDIVRSPVPPSIDAITAMSQNARTLLGMIDAQPDDKAKYNQADINFLNILAGQTGPTYVPFLEHLGAYEHGYVSVHSTYLGPGDIRIYKEHEVVINHNPESNAYLASGIAPIAACLQAGLTVSIGTDGAASNDHIDMLAAMRLMSHLQKVVALNIPLSDDLDSWGILRAATISGAKALQQEDRIGSVEPGKEADIVLINAGSFEMQPVTENPSCIANLLVNSAESKNIYAVISDGKIKVWDNHLVHVNEEDLAYRITEIRNQVMARVDSNKEGRKWIETINISDSAGPVVRYRSMYPNYSADVTVHNTGTKMVQAAIVISDAEKAAGYFYADETKIRFPSDPQEVSQQPVENVCLQLPPGEKLNLKKNPGGKTMQFIITSDAGFDRTIEITLRDDPEWAWALRANVYLEVKY